jgi:predicted transcriptional regulator
MGKKPESNLTRDDILSALTDMLGQQEEGEGMTTREIADALRIDDRKIQLMLADLKRAGRLRIHRVYRPAIDDIQRKVSAYSVVSSEQST